METTKPTWGYGPNCYAYLVDNLIANGYVIVYGDYDKDACIDRAIIVYHVENNGDCFLFRYVEYQEETWICTHQKPCENGLSDRLSLIFQEAKEWFEEINNKIQEENYTFMEESVAKGKLK